MNNESRNRCEIETGKEDVGVRLDIFLARRLGVSRSRVAALCRQALVSRVPGGGQVKPSTIVSAGNIFSLSTSTIEDSPCPGRAAPENIPLDIVFEDEHLLVVNKPASMVVHPAPGHYSGTLVNALLAHLGRGLDTRLDRLRPGIVHRLDKDTSGLLVVAKTLSAHQGLAQQIKERRAVRTYLAISWGHWPNRQDTIDIPVGRCRTNRKKMAALGTGGRPAKTAYRVLESYDIAELIEVTLHTGRTHQIRVHFSHRGHPVVGDPLYSGRAKAVRSLGSTLSEHARRAAQVLEAIDRQALHAVSLCFNHPHTGEPMSFSCPLPGDIEDVLGILREMG